MGQNSQNQKDVIMDGLYDGTPFFNERNPVPCRRVFCIHEPGSEDENDCADRCANLFCGVSANGRQFADILLFAVDSECKEIAVHFAVEKCYFKQCSYPCFSDSV